MLYDNSVITSKSYSTLSTLKHEKALRAYILRKTKCTQRTFDGVDWKAHYSAFNKLTVFQRISTAKLIHNLANTNRQNYLYYSTSPSCPGCLSAEETFEHVLICDHPPIVHHRHLQLQLLRNTLLHIPTPDKVVDVLMQGFSDWISSTTLCTEQT